MPRAAKTRPQGRQTGRREFSGSVVEDIQGPKVKKSQPRTRRRKATQPADQEAEFEKEEEIRMLEQRDVDAEWETYPSSEQEFEKLLAVRGDWAKVWIGYMAFHIQRGDIESARKVVHRGIERLDFRDMREKQNLWLAYLNMECAYGDRVMEVFAKAIHYNDAKTIHLKMINIFITNEKYEEAKEICKRGIKRFYGSKELWIEYLSLMYQKIKDHEEARKVYTTCMARVPEKIKLEITAATALLEFKFASAERGQMLFEKLLLENPKRMDIWMQYINAYINHHISDETKSKAESLKPIRKLFERIISLDLKPKKMKSIFKRWLEFEHQHGDERGQKHVQRRALEYVEAIERVIEENYDKGTNIDFGDDDDDDDIG